MLNKFKRLCRLLINIDIFKTIYFNLRYFKVKEALKFPIFIYKYSYLLSTRGFIIIKGKKKVGMIRFGGGEIGIFDRKRSRGIWQVSGTVVFEGNAHFGHGSKISVGENAVLKFGDNFGISAESSIVCHKHITFGDNCLLSWDILVMDTDFHKILNAKGDVINSPSPITIGRNVWIGCRSLILKGVFIGDKNVIAANSTITKSIEENQCVVCSDGKSVNILKRNIEWMP